MMYKKNIIKYLGFTILGIVLAVALFYAPDIGLCKSCYNVAEFGQFIFLFFLAFVPIFLILIFTKQQVFAVWKKFAIPYVTLSVILLVFSDDRGGSWGASSIIDNREGIALILSGLFLIISLLVITIKSLKLRKQEKQKLN